MKKNDVLLLSASILFSALFYEQSAGINFLLFTLSLTGALLFLNPLKWKDKIWCYYAICCNLSALAVFCINSDLSLFVCFISILVLSSQTLNRDNSILLALLFGLYSLLSAPIYFILNMAKSKEEKDGSMLKKRMKLIFRIAVSLFIIIVFFNLYRLSNPLFDAYTNFINLDWLSFSWIWFTFFGFLIFYGLLYAKNLHEIYAKEKSLQQTILPSTITQDDSDQHAVWIGLIVFLILNLMLLFLNGLDVINIYFTQTLPKGITLSDFVHQAVRSTVFSIIIAISMIAWFFKGDLNFNPQGKKVKLLVFVWIVQSLIVVVNTMVRNYNYIHEFQLSYLRIGVFVFLLLCVAGLVVTYIKIKNHESAWKLAVKNMSLWYLLLVLSSLINWDKAITQYNISHVNKNKKLDLMYLIYLSDANLPQLIPFLNNPSISESERQDLKLKINESIKKERFKQWQSFNLRMFANQTAVKYLNEKP